MRPAWIFAIVAAVVAVGAMVLTGGPERTGETAPVPGVAAAKTLRVGVVSVPPDRGFPWNTTGKPSIYTYRAMFDGLTAVAEDGTVEPYLATSWEQIDPLTWRFKLRENVKFHNGAAFTADAVVFAVDYMTDPAHVADLTVREFSDLASAEAEGPTSVIIRTKRPSPLLPAALELLTIVEPAHYQRLGREGFAAEPVGTGSFKLVRWSDNGAEFEALKDSWHPPQVDALHLIEIPEKSARIQAVLSGRVDVGISLGYEDVQLVEAGGGKAYVGKDSSVLGVTFVLSKLPEGHPLLNKSVRQALNYAVNKQAYINALFGGLTVPASQPAVPSSFGYNPDIEPYTYDPARAKAMLAEAGYPDGFSFMIEVPTGGGASLEEAYQMVAADLAQIGVAVTLKAITVPQLNRGVLQGEWTGQAFGMNYSAQRSTDALRPMRLHSCIHPMAWYCNEEVQAKITAAYNAPDLETRRELTQEVMAFYHDDAPAIWMHDVVDFDALGPRVQNYRADMTVIRFDQIALSDE